MAINLGDINFGLGPDTRRLRTAVQDVLQFGRAVNAAARSTAQGARQVEGALRRQEQAAFGAFQRVRAFHEAITRSNLTQKQAAQVINTSSTALGQLTNQMTRGQISTLAYQRSLTNFNIRMQNATLQTKQFVAANKQLQESQIIGFLQRFSQAAVLIAGPLSGAAARITVFSSLVSSTGIAIGGMIAGLAGAGLAFGVLASKAISAARSFDRFTLSMTSVTGEARITNAQLAAVFDLAQKGGIQFETLARGWARMQAAAAGTNLEGDRTWKIFEAVSLAAAKLGSSTEEAEGVLRAIEQIMSKGTVQAEELRGQLGDRLPGAVRIMAQALGVGTKELNNMLKKGQITSDVLVQFSETIKKRLGIDSSQAIDTVVAAEARLHNQVLITARTFDQAVGFSSAYKNILDGLTATLVQVDQWLGKVSQTLFGVNAGFGSVQGVQDYIDAMNGVTTSTKAATEAMIDQERVRNVALQGAITEMVTELEEAQKILMHMKSLSGGSLGALFPSGAVQQQADFVAQLRDRYSELSHQAVESAVRLKQLDDILSRPSDNGPLDPIIPGSDASAKRTTKAIREAQQSILELSQTYKTLFMTPGQQEFTEMQNKINHDVQDFADKLKDAGVSADVASVLTAKYALALELVEKTRLGAQRTVTAVELLSDVFRQAGTQAVNSFVDSLLEGENALKSLENIAKQVVASILKSLLQLAIINPLLNGLFGLGLPVLGGVTGTGATANVGAVTQHLGGPAGLGRRRMVPMGFFANAPRLHDGLRNDEYAAILQKGETVIPKGGSGGGITVNVNNYSQEQVETSASEVNGEVILDVVVGKVFDRLRRGDGDGLMRSRYNLRPVQRRTYT